SRSRAQSPTSGVPRPSRPLIWPRPSSTAVAPRSRFLRDSRESPGDDASASLARPQQEGQMFGTVASMRAKPDMELPLLELMEEWGRARGTVIPGAVHVYVARSERDSGLLLMIALFDSREHYFANANH